VATVIFCGVNGLDVRFGWMSTKVSAGEKQLALQNPASAYRF
jgi:hypothetical protein